MNDNSCTIESLNEAIKFFLEGTRILPKKRVRHYLMYRGHSSYKYFLQPSVFRSDRLKYEALLFQELKRFSPFDFPSANSDIENLIKMQHYGLPTRLLDFTLNPLVALYFACQVSKDEKHKNDDGEIIVIYDSIKQIDSIEVERCAKLITYQGTSEKAFQQRMSIKERLSIGPSENDEELVDLSVMKKYFPQSYCFIPAIHNNERISRQNGVFMLFGYYAESKTPFRKTPFIIKKEILETLNHKLNTHIIIPSQKKSEILSELDTIGINHAFLFPELEHQATYLANKYSSSN